MAGFGERRKKEKERHSQDTSLKDVVFLFITTYHGCILNKLYVSRLRVKQLPDANQL